MSAAQSNDGHSTIREEEQYERRDVEYSPIQYESSVRQLQAQPITLQPQALQSPQAEEFELSVSVSAGARADTRRPIPVSTLDWRSTTTSQFIPVHGLDFLIGVNAVLIQQTLELGDLMSSMESVCRYSIRIPDGETLYVASELSTALQRLLCGSSRSLSMSITDHTRQEALILNRTSNCIPCRPQELHVLSPPGEYLGRVHQQWTLSVPLFLISNDRDDLMFVVEGPNMNTVCCKTMEAEFKILSGDAMTVQGTIVHGWDPQLVNYVLRIDFPSTPNAADPRVKALVIAAAFLLEYTYFVRAKSTKCLAICC